MERVKVTFLRHQELTARASEIAEAGQEKTVTLLNREIQEVFVEAQHALDAYRNHVREHGCEQKETEKALAVPVGKQDDLRVGSVAKCPAIRKS